MPQVSALKREEVEDLFSFQEGFHDLDWMRAAAMIEQKFELLDQPTGFHDLVLMWLERLREDLGGSYGVCGCERCRDFVRSTAGDSAVAITVCAGRHDCDSGGFGNARLGEVKSGCIRF